MSQQISALWLIHVFRHTFTIFTQKKSTIMNEEKNLSLVWLDELRTNGQNDRIPIDSTPQTHTHKQRETGETGLSLVSAPRRYQETTSDIYHDKSSVFLSLLLFSITGEVWKYVPVPDSFTAVLSCSLCQIQHRITVYYPSCIISHPRFYTWVKMVLSVLKAKYIFSFFSQSNV